MLHSADEDFNFVYRISKKELNFPVFCRKASKSQEICPWHYMFFSNSMSNPRIVSDMSSKVLMQTTACKACLTDVMIFCMSSIMYIMITHLIGFKWNKIGSIRIISKVHQHGIITKIESDDIRHHVLFYPQETVCTYLFLLDIF